MPNAPGLPPLKPVAAAAPVRTTAERGYGTEHEKLRERLLVKHPVCQRCSADWSHHLHHKDRNPFNRAESNCEMLCVACHKAEHRKR